MYEKFIKSFYIFDKLHILTIRIIKQNHQLMHNPHVLRKEQDISGIIMIINGNFQLYDDDMILQNEF